MKHYDVGHWYCVQEQEILTIPLVHRHMTNAHISHPMSFSAVMAVEPVWQSAWLFSKPGTMKRNWYISVIQMAAGRPLKSQYLVQLCDNTARGNKHGLYASPWPGTKLQWYCSMPDLRIQCCPESPMHEALYPLETDTRVVILLHTVLECIEVMYIVPIWVCIYGGHSAFRSRLCSEN